MVKWMNDFVVSTSFISGGWRLSIIAGNKLGTPT